MEDMWTMLDLVSSGELSVDQAVLELKKEPFSEAGFDELGFAKLDTHRRLRQGIAEVIYGAGKTAEQLAGIVEAMKKRGQELVLITRMDPEKARHTEDLLKQKFEMEPASGILTVPGSAYAGTFRKRTESARSWSPLEGPAISRWLRRQP